VWKIDAITCPQDEAASSSPAPEATEPPTSDGMSFQVVEIPQVGLSFEMPADWQRIESEWAWAPGSESALRLGVNGVGLEPPMEPEAVLLPNHAQILDAVPIQLAWGEGRRFLLERYAPAAESDGAEVKAPIEAVEMHALSVIELDGESLGLDLYASAPTAEALAGMEPLFQHVLATAQVTGAPAAKRSYPSPTGCLCGTKSSASSCATPPTGPSRTCRRGDRACRMTSRCGA
jgi:hypothetical protein